MSAIAAEPAPSALAHAQRTYATAVRIARSYGPLRACTSVQAPVIRRAAEIDRRVLPRWQRGGDGIHEWAEPGSYLGLAAWSSRTHWLDVAVPAAIRARPEALERYRVSPEMFTHWCDTISLYAHARTGRRVIVRPDRLAELMGVCKRTVQRCQKAAEDLGLYVIITPGRMLTADETYAARAQGSRQRGLSNDAALVVPTWLRAQISRASITAGRSHVTPTSGRYRSSFKLQVISSLETRSAGDKAPPPAGLSQRRGGFGQQDGPEGPQMRSRASRRRAQRVYDPEALQLARDLTEAVGWLKGTQAGRLEPGLRRFANCRVPWLASDIIAAIDLANQRLGRASMTRSIVQNPPALLASYLRELDVDADHPLGPDYVPDPANPRRERLSPTQRANRARAELAWATAHAVTPDRAAAWISAARDLLADPDTAPPPPPDPQD